MPTARSSLRVELSESLIPSLQAIGFTGPSAISGNALLHKFKRPGSRGSQVVTVQLEKNGLPRFVLGLVVEPSEGFEAVRERGGIVRQGRVQPKRGKSTRAWFRADPEFWKRVIGKSASTEKQAVSACVALLPEVEAWWHTEASSEHITVFEMKYPGPKHAVA